MKSGALILLSGLAPGLAANAQTPPAGLDPRAPLQVRDVLGIRDFADRVQVDVAPDGRSVAYTLQDPVRAAAANAAASSPYYSTGGVPRAMAGTDIYVTEVVSSQTRNITQAVRSSNWSPSWSPDGQSLVFFSDRDGLARLWLWTRATRTLRRVAAEPVRAYFGFEGIRWSPNGRRVAVKLSPLNYTRSQLDRLLPQAARVTSTRRPVDSVTAVVFSSVAADTAAVTDTAATPVAINVDSTRSFLNTELADLGMIDVVTGRVKRLALRARVMGWHWNPDGKSIAFTTRQPDAGTGMLVYDRYDLWVVDTAGGPPRLLVPRIGQEYGLAFSWSPNGHAVAYVSDGHLFVVPREGGEPKQLGGEHDFTSAYRAPLWHAEDALLAISRDTLFRVSVTTGEAKPVAVPEGRRLMDVVLPADAQRAPRDRLMIAVHDPATKLSGFRTIDFANGTFPSRIENQFAFAGDLPYSVDVSSNGGVIVFAAERGERPPEVWMTGDELTHINRITNLNPQVTRLALGATRMLQWTGPRGETLRGALLMPGNYEPGKRFPLVVKVYGGSMLSSRLNRFGLEPGIDNLHLLSTRGYGVLLPDTPLREGTPLEDLEATVMPGVDSAIALGLADPDRLALMGHSYGGYSALALLVQTQRFKAAISSGGFSNLFSQYTAMRDDGSAVGINWSERDQGRMGGHAWEFRDRYLANSPFFFLDSVTTPVLLLHGGADRTVEVARADETFVALRRLGKTVEYVRYEGEGHHPGSWSVANATDYWNRIFAWLDRYVR